MTEIDPPLKTTPYFQNEVLRKRSFLKLIWIQMVLTDPLRTEQQPDGRFRVWGRIPEDEPLYGGKVLRVILERDRETVHNTFPDRGFKS